MQLLTLPLERILQPQWIACASTEIRLLYSHASSIVILDALPNCRQQRCKYERLADSILTPCDCIIES
jgi:hypothetical protein